VVPGKARFPGALRHQPLAAEHQHRHFAQRQARRPPAQAAASRATQRARKDRVNSVLRTTCGAQAL
jgi:hypothetical protein